MSLLPWRMRTPLTRTLPPRVGAHCSISTTAISWRPGPSLLTKTATSSHIYPGKTGARHQTVINNYLIKIAKSSFMIMQYNLITNSQSTVKFYFWIYVKCFSLLLNFYLPVINLCKTAWVKQIHIMMLILFRIKIFKCLPVMCTDLYIFLRNFLLHYLQA